VVQVFLVAVVVVVVVNNVGDLNQSLLAGALGWVGCCHLHCPVWLEVLLASSVLSCTVVLTPHIYLPASRVIAAAPTCYTCSYEAHASRSLG
jgi:hypothetical protein